jgi:enoyl-CoA hydratase/carnithine racemase
LSSSILFKETPGGIGLLTINRPEVKNALNWEAMESFGAVVSNAASDNDLRALVISGTGGSFCSGGDLYELDQYPTRLDGARLTGGMGDTLKMLESLPFPTIAAIDGPAVGGGAEIALACDLRIMAEDSSLGCMHIRLGIIPAWGGGQRLMRIVGYSRAMEWLAIGRVLSASEAQDFGLVNRIVAKGKAVEVSTEIAQEIAQRDPEAVRSVKRLLQAGNNLSPDEALEEERSLFPELWAAPAHLEASSHFVSRKNHRVRSP